MKKIWAPWRMTYIGAGQLKGCFLCEKAQARTDDINYVLARSQNFFVIMNTFPYNNGHLMIAPLKHLSSPILLTAEEGGEFWQITNKCLQILGKVLKTDSFNLGMNLGASAGAGLDSHFHLHIIPRWQGDTNFMPLVAEVKVISEHLDTTFKKLRRYFKTS